MDQFIGEIRMVGFNFEPVGWAFCWGQSLPIANYQALFALLGTQFGGDGVKTFNLPDLRGRVPINSGNGTGLSPYNIGENGGTENVTLVSSQMPMHNHSIAVNDTDGTVANPANAILAKGKLEPSRSHEAVHNYTASVATGTLAPTAVSQAGDNQPHPNMQPYLTVNFIIALTGIFPTRN